MALKPKLDSLLVMWRIVDFENEIYIGKGRWYMCTQGWGAEIFVLKSDNEFITSSVKHFKQKDNILAQR